MSDLQKNPLLLEKQRQYTEVNADAYSIEARAMLVDGRADILAIVREIVNREMQAQEMGASGSEMYEKGLKQMVHTPDRNDVRMFLENYETVAKQKFADIDAFAQKIVDEVNGLYGSMQNAYDRYLKRNVQNAAEEIIEKISEVYSRKNGEYSSVREEASLLLSGAKPTHTAKKDELISAVWASGSQYWLGYAVVALKAEALGEDEIFRDAVARALSLDAEKTNLFFSLTTLKNGDLESARNWLISYFTTIDPRNVKETTFTLIRAYLNGFYGEDDWFSARVNTIFDEWICSLNADPVIYGDSTRMFGLFLEHMRSDSTIAHEKIRTLCPDILQYQSTMNNVRKYKKLYDYFATVQALAEGEENTYFKEMVASSLTYALDSLVGGESDEEERLNDVRFYFDRVLKDGGDFENAEKLRAEKSEKKERSLMQSIVRWSICQTKEDALSMRFALSRSKGAFKQAIADFDRALTLPEGIVFNADEKTSFACTKEDKTLQRRRFKHQTRKNGLKRSVVTKWNVALSVASVVALCLLLCAQLASWSPVISTVAAVLSGGLLLGLVAGVTCGFIGYLRKQKKILALFDECCDETARLFAEYDDCKQEKNAVLELLDSF